MTLFPALVAIVVHFLVIVCAKPKLRPAVALLWITSLYYSVLGPSYWLFFKDGEFLGVNWTDEMPRATAYVGISALCLALAIMALDTLLSAARKSVGKVSTGSHDYSLINDIDWGKSVRIWQAVFALGLISTLVVFGQIMRGAADAESIEKLNLVAYQFSDLLIPCIVFVIGARGLDKLTLPMLVSFTAYAAIVGFRYKLVLVYFPLVVIYLFPVLGPKNVSKIKGSLIIIGAAVGFSVLTITRSKFSGIDFQALSAASADDMLYGFFAESNTIFGLIGVLHESVDAKIYVHLDPIRDTLLELVPRAILPDRVTGSYLGTPLERLIAEEAMNSGTAYPYLGELLLMGGHFALALGTVILAGVYLSVSRLFERLPVGAYRLANAGYGLIAVYFGYYYFSRGYLPQTFKAFIFIVVPFVVMVAFVGHRRAVMGGEVGSISPGSAHRSSNIIGGRTRLNISESRK